MNIGISDFARNRHKPESGKTHFLGTEDELLSLIAQNREQRRSGRGEKGSLDRKVCVPLPPERFSDLNNYHVTEDMILEARLDRRQSGEDPYIGLRATGIKRYLSKCNSPADSQHLLNNDQEILEDETGCYVIDPLPKVRPTFAYVVLYSAAALTENGGVRSGNFDWEVVAMIATDVPDEPMHPLTMARNQLAMTGGTKSEYTAEEYAESIAYWSQRVAGFRP